MALEAILELEVETSRIKVLGLTVSLHPKHTFYAHLSLLWGDVGLPAGLVILLRGKEDALEVHLCCLGPLRILLGVHLRFFELALERSELCLDQGKLHDSATS